jgi:hypothetical protein
LAVVGQFRVESGAQADHEALDAVVSGAMDRGGGPPAALMAHLVRPDGEGFVVLQVWRSEAEMRRFHESVLMPALDQLNLVSGKWTVWPLWGFAAP